MFFLNFTVPADPVANEQRLRHVGRIPYSSFNGVLITLFAVACFTVVTRIVLRIYSRRRLFLDDYFILFGLVCLAGATGLILHNHFIRSMFVSEAIKMDHSVSVTLQDIMGLTGTKPILQAFLCLAWTATFSVKFSFLAVFKILIRRISKRITIYFWIVVAFTLCTWMFLVGEPFILCPTNATCVPGPPVVLGLALTITITILDVATDIMIVSIPILILQKSQMRLSQKLGLGVFLCLSIFMALAAVVRVSGYYLRGEVDTTWSIFWQYLEACIATIMGSVTAFRTLFIQGGSRKTPEKQKESYSIRQRFLRRTGRLNREWEDMSKEHLPKVPSATLTGIRTFINNNGHSTETMHSDEENLHSQMEQSSIK